MTGCDRVSAGCDHCYALAFAERLKAMGQPRYQADGDPRTSGPGFGLTLHPDLVDLPRRWRKPATRRLRERPHARIPLEHVQRVVETMRATPQHTYQVLTKRARRLALLSEQVDWPANVWVGTSVEDSRVLHRADDLRRVHATTRFLSLEPLIGPLPDLDLDGIDWVSVAGESGPGARPMAADWVREIRDRCVERDVPLFFLQWGSATRGGGRVLDGRTWEQLPRSGSATGHTLRPSLPPDEVAALDEPAAVLRSA